MQKRACGRLLPGSRPVSTNVSAPAVYSLPRMSLDENRAEKTTVGGFVGEPAHGAKTQIDGAGSKLTGFEMRAITQDHDPVEGQARLRAAHAKAILRQLTACVSLVIPRWPDLR